MGWWPFQVPADIIRAFKTPKWLKLLLQEVQDIIVSSALQIGKEYIILIENKIAEVDSMPIEGSEKFRRVFDYARDLGIAAPESIMNVILNSMVLRFKGRKAF